jgi:isoleucyl-tRNA synthetase
MSKSLGNYTDPNELMDKYSADSLRFLLLSSPLLSGEDFTLKDKDVGDVARKLSMVWNMYDFFTMYAEVDGFTFPYSSSSTDAFLAQRMPNTPRSDTPASSNGIENEHPYQITVNLDKLQSPLDRWIVSRLHQTAQHVGQQMDAYNLPEATSVILPFLDDASNWFVRRSRRRFWKSEDDADKNQAYQTLHYVLSYLALVLAPFAPFMAEELHQKMVGDTSVHLLDWPEVGAIDQAVLDDMARTREIITEGLALRMSRDDEFGQIKVRQPLERLEYSGARLGDFYEQIIAEEVNVKTVQASELAGSVVVLDKKLTPELRAEGFARELIRHIQSARKSAGLNVDDRIRLSFDRELVGAEYLDLIKTETLTVDITGDNYAYDEIVQIDGANITISLEKA